MALKPARRRKKSRVTQDEVQVADPAPQRKGPGRPKWVPDAAQQEQIVKLAELDHTIPEIAGWFGLNEKTLDRRLAEMPELKERVEAARHRARASFRQMMWRLARAGNPKAIGLLGAKMGWYPQAKIEHGGSVAIPVVVVPDNRRAIDYGEVIDAESRAVGDGSAA
jgi:hypothetical protein